MVETQQKSVFGMISERVNKQPQPTETKINVMESPTVIKSPTLMPPLPLPLPPTRNDLRTVYSPDRTRPERGFLIQ